MRKFFLSLGIFAAFGVFGHWSFGGSQGTYSGETTSRTGTISEGSVPTFTLDQAILTALQRNPTLLNAEQEIKRTKGVVLQVSAQALPRIAPTANLAWTDHRLSTSGFAASGGISGGAALGVETAYAIRITGSQLLFNYSTVPSIRGSFFQRDSAYFSFRNILDQLISTVKTQFYQIIVNRELVSVNEENVHLLEAQLKDQQNRFEAGTVPRFNVLQAEVQLHNQLPQLITAQNNLRISKLQLAKTLGLDFQRRRGNSPPLDVIGDMPYVPRTIELVDAIEMGKQRRPFLKQARANVLNQKEQVQVALGGFWPNFTNTGGYDIFSSPLTTAPAKTREGFVFGLQGNWAVWDSGATYGQVIQQRALLSETKITYDDDVRQVELEIQQAYSNLQQNRELIQSQEKNVELAEEAVRLAKARLDAGAGVQLDVLNATVQLLTAQSTRLQALFGYNSSLAEFDRATGAQSTYSEMFANLKPRATTTKTYYTGSDVDAMGKPKETGEERVTTTTRRTSSK